MSKHDKKTSSLLHYPVLVVFSLFFIGLFALDLVTPDRSYSELENTTLSQRPALTQFTAKGLNSYFTAYTKYVKDQVAGRDQWISLQSAAETTLFQKTQSGGILLGREHMMFARHYSILKNEEKGMAKNLAAIQSLAQRYPGRVNLMLVPSASVVYPENVPAGAPQIDEKGIGNGISILLFAGIIAIYPVIMESISFGKGPIWKVIKILWSMASISVACQITTLPFAWYYFQAAPHYFLITNLFAVPLVTASIYSFGFAYLTYGIPVIGEISGYITTRTVQLLNLIIDFIGSQPSI